MRSKPTTMNPILRFPARLVRYLAYAVLLGRAGLAPALAAESESAPVADGFWATRDGLDQTFSQRLSGLADKCEGLKLDAQAQVTRRWASRRDPHRQYLFLPADTDPLQPPADAETVVQQWYKRFRQLRQDHAQGLFQLARSELDAGRATRAYQLLHEVLHENPDHEPTRQILGYRQVNGRWRKPEGTVRSRVMNVPQSPLGFNAGQYWSADSEHFSLTTNYSQPEAERLVASLEDLYGVWQQVFFSYWSSAAALTRRFDSQLPPARAGSRYKVVLFRERQQYVDRLKALEPQIEVSVGYYAEPAKTAVGKTAPTKTAYFYSGAENAEEKCFHEVTHQLFSETGSAVPPVGLKNNIWIVEGAALYMESLQRWEHGWTLGGQDARLLQYARYRLLDNKFYLPLNQFVALGRQGLQQHPDIGPLYSQAAGLAAFLMDYRRGVYRDAMVNYLQAVYQGRDREDTLPSLTRVPFGQLDEQYRHFLQQITDEDLAYLAAQPSARTLYLGHSAVTDAGLAQLAGLTQLKELWLGGTQISDQGLVHLRNLKNLETLDVGATRVTADGLKQLQATLPSLKED
ncbi:MAG: hypothetical protein NTY19_46860 [Planctomycetota bacterium]|nr:hypothetical protein [Planctomycetota bacterium]